MKMTVNLDQREVLNNSEGGLSFIIVFNTQIYKNVICMNQGHPTTTFCKISVRRSKYCLEFSIA